MCGILGYIGQVKYNPKNIKILGLYNEARGDDSFGLYNHLTEKDFEDRVFKYKDKCRETELIRGNIEPSHLCIGHTRSQSKGHITKENAHPFAFDSCCGVHNGGIENYEELAKKYGVEIKNADSDSYALYKILGQTGGDFQNVLSDVSGSAALAFTLNDDKLYLYRKDNQRPLYVSRYYFHDSWNSAMFFSSIKESLEAINVPENSIEEIEPGYVYEYGMDTELKGTYEIKDNPHKPIKVNNFTTYGRNYYDFDWEDDPYGVVGRTTPTTASAASQGKTRSQSSKEDTPYSTRQIPKHILNHGYIIGDKIYDCYRIENKVDIYTKYILESGAIAILKGDRPYTSAVYNRNTASSIINEVECKRRGITYDLFCFDDGSFIEFNRVVSNQTVHTEDISTEDEPDGSEKDNLGNLWGHVVDLRESLNSVESHLPQESFSKEFREAKEVLDQMEDDLTELSQEMGEKETEQ